MSGGNRHDQHICSPGMVWTLRTETLTIPPWGGWHPIASRRTNFKTNSYQTFAQSTEVLPTFQPSPMATPRNTPAKTNQACINDLSNLVCVISFLHTVAGNPTKHTCLRMINAGNYNTWDHLCSGCQVLLYIRYHHQGPPCPIRPGNPVHKPLPQLHAYTATLNAKSTSPCLRFAHATPHSTPGSSHRGDSCHVEAPQPPIIYLGPKGQYTKSYLQCLEVFLLFFCYLLVSLYNWLILLWKSLNL